MDIKLNVTFLNQEGCVEHTAIAANKQKLIDSSDYFKSLFTNQFSESTTVTKENELCIDLTQLKYTCSDKYIKLLFSTVLTGYNYKVNNKRSIKIIMDTESEICETKCDILVDVGVGADIPIQEMYILSTICDYFSFNKCKDVLENCLINYRKLFGPYNHPDTKADESTEQDAECCDENDDDDSQISCKLCRGNIEHRCCDEEEEETINVECEYCGTEFKDYEAHKCKGPCTADDYENEKYVAEDCGNVDIEEYIITLRESSIIENIFLSFDKIVSVDKFKLNLEIDNYKKIYLINNFLKNIYYIYLSYKQADKLDLFKDLVKTISTSMRQTPINSHFGEVNIYLPKIEVDKVILTNDILQQIPLEDCYELIKLSSKIISLESDIFKLYEFYDILNYEKSSWDLFKCQKKIDYEINKKCINPKDVVMGMFREETNGIFDELDWNNVILTGGFLFGLVNNLTSSLINSTDIDLFVYNANNEDEDTDHNTSGSKETNKIQNKIQYLLQYFNKYNPYYITRGRVITMIIPNFQYDIQIIPTNKTSPLDIINTFDFSYVKLYYDGEDIFTTLEGLISLKHAITVCKPQKDDNEVADARLYKTILKGVSIKYDPIIKNKYIKDNMIDYDAMEKDEEITVTLNKCTTIKKLLNHLTGLELIPIIKACYKSNNVTMDMNKIYSTNKSKDNDKDDNDEYDPFSSKSIMVNNIKMTDIAELIKQDIGGAQFKFSLKMKNKTVLDYISLQTDYCSFNVRQFKPETDRFRRNENCIILDIDKQSEKKLNDLSELLQKKLKDVLGSISKKYIAFDLNIFQKPRIDEDLDDDDNFFSKMNKSLSINKTKLKVHLHEKHKNYDKLNNFLAKLNPENDKVKVICSGKIWFNKAPQQGTNRRQCGIKFYLDSIKCKTAYNVISE